MLWNEATFDSQSWLGDLLVILVDMLLLFTKVFLLPEATDLLDICSLHLICKPGFSPWCWRGELLSPTIFLCDFWCLRIRITSKTRFLHGGESLLIFFDFDDFSTATLDSVWVFKGPFYGTDKLAESLTVVIDSPETDSEHFGSVFLKGPANAYIWSDWVNVNSSFVNEFWTKASRHILSCRS